MTTNYEVLESDIAIVGMAARLPGARNVDAFLQNLRSGTRSIRTLSEEELLANGEDPAVLRRKDYVRAAATLDDVPMFDGEFFGFSPKESAIMDPQHRHFLECAWEALEHAGHVPERFDGRVGVFSGCGMGSYLYFHLCSHPELVRDVGMFLLRHTGNDKDFLSTRVSYLFNLDGPSLGVQTACSTSLVAVHLAAQSLISGECDMALAGGVTIELPHGRGYIYNEGEVLSPDGLCHAFDHRSAGTVFGSGLGVVVLRRLEDALRDDDIIHAVVRGSAVNNDGSRKMNYLAPSVDGQAACMVEAYSVADVDPRSIEYVECHGTGTYMGDPIEVAALTQAFRSQTDERQFCKIGSVKTNIGHLDTAAGVASLIKAALSLEHKQFLPTVSFEAPNPNIDFDSSPFSVATELCEWPAPADHPRRAAVNSLGVGGTNAHVVLQEPPPREASGPASRDVQLLTLSARSQASLDAGSQRLAAHLRAHPEQPLADVAYTLHHGRRHFEKRRVLAACSHEEAAQLLESGDALRVFTHTASDETGAVVFALPGGGAQYPRMAADLYEREPVFRRALDEGLALLQEKHDIDLRPLLLPGDGAEPPDEALAQMVHQLPATFLISVAMARLLESRGVVPAALLGHSAGQNTAAYLAGVMGFEECLGLLVLRGRLFMQSAPGAMLSVNLPASELAHLLPETLDLAVVNAPEACVVSGPPEAIDRFAQQLAERDVDCRRVAIPTAAHSRQLDPVLPEFEAYLRSIQLSKPAIPVLCNTSGGWLTDEQATDPTYWARHLRSQVRFADNVDALLSEGTRVVVECGPGRTLTSLVRQSDLFRKRSHQAFPSVRHRDEQVRDDVFFTTCLGRIWACGGELDWQTQWPDERRQRVALPTYAWNHKPYFVEPLAAPSAGTTTDALEKLKDLRRWGATPVWVPVPGDAVTDEGGHVWLFFMDLDGLGERLKARLEQRGDRVITVYQGDAYAKRGPFEYTLSPERGKEGYVQLLSDLVQEGRTPDRLVHLWLSEPDAAFRPGSSLFHHHQERGFYSLFFIAQAMADQGFPACHLTVVTTGAQRVDDDEGLPHPEKATVLGPVQVMPRELEGTTASCVDVRPPSPPRLREGLETVLRDPRHALNGRERALDKLAEQLDRELRLECQNRVVALRGDKRFERHFVRTPLPALEDRPGCLRQGGCYLITGGLGGIGLTAAEYLARACAAKLVLLSRTPLPTRGRWSEWIRQHGVHDRTSQKLQRILAIEEAGGQVVPVAADVTNMEELRAALHAAEQELGPICGVVHAAGTIADELIALKSVDSVEDVFAPKIQGTRVLTEVLGDRELDFLLLFSSTSTATAPAGQVDYVAANAYLDAYAESQAHAPTRVTSLHWGIWSEVGMAAEQLDDERAARKDEPVGEQPDHPVLSARIGDAWGHVVLAGQLSPSTHWVLNEHRTKDGQALMPGTGYLELARAALRASGEQGPFEVEDLFFIGPFGVEDDDTRELRVQLRPSQRGYEFECRGRVELDGKIGWELHAQAHLALSPLPPPGALDIAALEGRCQARSHGPAPEGLRTRQEAHLAFGPRFRCLNACGFGDGEGVARLSLPTAFRGELGELGLHPALLDIATGWAMDLIEGYEAQTLWVPVVYERARVYADLTPEVVSWVRLNGAATAESDFAFFDVTLAAPDGRVLVEVDRLGLRRTAPDAAFSGRAASARNVLFEPPPSADERSVARQQLARNLARGITPEEGQEALARVLGGPRRPQIYVSSLDLTDLIRQAEAPSAEEREAAAPLVAARPDTDTEYVEPRDPVEKTLVAYWQELLGVDRVGVEDSFFDLGGHSLIAVRLFARIKQAYRVEFPISVLFEAPTIARCAALIREAIGDAGLAEAAQPEGGEGAPSAPRTRYTHLVTMHSGDGGPKTPFFLVAGMFGNVLNLRHLAHLVGVDRRFYGLQARGLYGDQQPHETFEDMARDYIREIRTVQPHGPYLLGGFSGGGVTAMEMAQQLHAAGEEVPLVVLLDTPVPAPPPALGVVDRAKIQVTHLKQRGPGYLSEWAVNRFRWEAERLRKRMGRAIPKRSAEEFHNEEIEAAFRRALTRYEVKPWGGPVTLFRPKPQVAYDLGNGRLLNVDRDYILSDNGWSPYVEQLEIREVPGDHDSMVLEPNVRVLARLLRETIEATEARLRARPAELTAAQ